MILDNKSKSELIKKIGIVDKKQAIYKRDFQRKNRIRPICLPLLDYLQFVYQQYVIYLECLARRHELT